MNDTKIGVFVTKVSCPDCDKVYNAEFHKKCPYCKELQINTLNPQGIDYAKS